MRFSCFRYFIDRHENRNELPVTYLISCLTSKSLENIIFILITVYYSFFTLYEGNALPNATRNPLYELCGKGIPKNVLFLYFFFSPIICNDYRKMGKQKEPLIYNSLSLRQINEQQFSLCPTYIRSPLDLLSPTVLRFKYFCKPPL